jgi:hypothetical protein
VFGKTRNRTGRQETGRKCAVGRAQCAGKAEEVRQETGETETGESPVGADSISALEAIEKKGETEKGDGRRETGEGRREKGNGRRVKVKSTSSRT